MKLTRRSALLGLLCAPFARRLPSLAEEYPYKPVVEPMRFDGSLDDVFTRHSYNMMRRKDSLCKRAPLLELLREREGRSFDTGYRYRG